MENIHTNTYLTVIASLMVNVVVFGLGAITILSVPALSDLAKFLLPAWIAFSLVLTPFISWRIAPRMRLRHRRERENEQRAHLA